MSEQEIDLQWTQIGENKTPETSWHLIANTYISRASFWFVKTRCGLDDRWDQTFVDRLPGGSEKACENCLVLLAGDVDKPAKKSAKKK